MHRVAKMVTQNNGVQMETNLRIYWVNFYQIFTIW